MWFLSRPALGSNDACPRHRYSRVYVCVDPVAHFSEALCAEVSKEGAREREDDSSIARLCGDIVKNKVGAARALMSIGYLHTVYVIKVSLLVDQMEIIN